MRIAEEEFERMLKEERFNPKKDEEINFDLLRAMLVEEKQEMLLENTRINFAEQSKQKMESLNPAKPLMQPKLEMYI